MGGEVDAEPGDGRFQLGPGAVLEGELALHRARGAGREQALLAGLGQSPQRREGLAVVLHGEPVERERRAVGQHGLARAHRGEGVVVGPERRPVRGLADRDVERVVVVAGGEYRAAHLEQHEVEGGREILREMRLDQRGADGAEVVAEPYADARLLARLGFRVGTRGRHGRSGDGGRLDAGDAGLIAAVIVLPCRIRVAGLLGRHVLGPDQALDDLQLAVPADGGDASGDREILMPERGPRFDRGLDLLEPGLDGVGFGHEFLGPRVVVHLGELVVTGPQALALGLLLAGGLSRLGMDPAEAGEVGPVDIEARLGPLPAGRELVRRGLEALGGELVQEIGIFEPDAPLVLVGEQVAVDPSAGRLVSLDANEVRGDGGGGTRSSVSMRLICQPLGR